MITKPLPVSFSGYQFIDEMRPGLDLLGKLSAKGSNLYIDIEDNPTNDLEVSNGLAAHTLDPLFDPDPIRLEDLAGASS